MLTMWHPLSAKVGTFKGTNRENLSKGRCRVWEQYNADGRSGLGMKMTIYFHLVLTLIKHGAILIFIIIKHMDKCLHFLTSIFLYGMRMSYRIMSVATEEILAMKWPIQQYNALSFFISKSNQ
jgi:hypothetical protein